MIIVFMSSNMITFHNIKIVNLENPNKIVLQNHLNIDTEPELEVNNNHNIHSIVSLTSNNQLPSKNEKFITKEVKNNTKNPFEELIEIIPTYQYDPKLIRRNKQKMKIKEETVEKIANNIRDTNNNRFFNLYEAFLYVAEVCYKNSQRFTRDNCRRYLKECYIINFANDSFVPIMSHLTQKKFNQYYHLALREFKYI